MNRVSLGFILLFLILFKGSPVASPKLIHIFTPIVLKATQSSPPYIAFQVAHQSINTQFTNTTFEANYQMNLEVDLNDQKSSFIKYDGQTLASYVPETQPVMQLDEMRFSSSYMRFQNVQAENLQTQNAENHELKAHYSGAAQAMALPPVDEVAEIDMRLSQIDLNDFSPRQRDRLRQSGVLSSQTSVASANSAATPDQTAASAAASLPNPVIYGNYQLSGGVGITNEHHVELRRIENGRTKDVGQVNLHDGRYQIQVSAFTGELVAQIIHTSGRVDGATRVKLNPAALVRKNTYYFQGPLLNVSIVGVVAINSNDEKNKQSASPFRYYNGLAASKEKSINVEASKSDGGPSVAAASTQQMTHFYQGSSTLVYKAEDKKSLGTLALVEADQESVNFENYRKSFLEGTVSFINDMYRENLDINQPVIIGKLSGSESLVGSEVSIRNNPYAKIFYFDQFYIPQPADSKMHSNGSFIAFLDTEGLVTIDVRKDGVLNSYINTVVEQNKLSLVQPSALSESVDVVVRAYDAFTGIPTESQLELQALEDVVDIPAAETLLKLKNRNNLGYAFASDTNEYLSSHFEYKEARGFIHLPRIKRNWLNQLVYSEKKNILPQTGMIVGFVQEDNFEVFLPSQIDQNRNPDQYEIIYFDSQGNKSEKGLAGGGFVILNVFEKTHEVMVQFQSSEVVINKITPIQAGHIFTHTFSLKNF